MPLVSLLVPFPLKNTSNRLYDTRKSKKGGEGKNWNHPTLRIYKRLAAVSLLVFFKHSDHFGTGRRTWQRHVTSSSRGRYPTGSGPPAFGQEACIKTPILSITDLEWRNGHVPAAFVDNPWTGCLLRVYFLWHVCLYVRCALNGSDLFGYSEGNSTGEGLLHTR